MCYQRLFIFLFSASGLFLACGEEPEQSDDPNIAQEEKEEANAETCLEGSCDLEDVKVEPRKICSAPAGVNNAPASIQEFVELLNAAPKPLEVPCLLDMLARPLQITGTTSRLSVQPAESASSPRIFIEKDGFYISVVPEGDGRKAVEVSEITTLGRSVKADFEFPLEAAVTNSSGFERILRTDNSGTTCGACHGGEAAYPAFGPDVYDSKAFRPMGSQSLALSELLKLSKGCKGKRSERCDLINAIFDGGEVNEHKWPGSIPSMF